MKHVIFISFDAFSEDNWKDACKLPNISRLVKHGAYSTKLKSVYPTLTYTVHATMVTGCYPEKHHIFHNQPTQPFKEELEWFWYRDSIKVPTVYDEIRKRKMSVASILWPVTGKASIKYNIPEMVAINNENQLLKVLKGGSPLFCIDMQLRYGKYRKGKEQPYLDDFSTMCAVDTIKRKKPNLLLLHLIEIDDAKHSYGTKSTEVVDAIKHMDKRIGDIMQAVETAGISKDTMFIIAGDHGQLDVQYNVHLNNILKRKSLIYEENGIKKWRAYIQEAGGSAILHIKEGDVEAEEIALDALKNAINNGQHGIERIFDRNDLDDLHVDKNVKYMIEAKEGYSFINDIHEPDVTAISNYATHGYLPDKENYKGIFIASTPPIKQGFDIGETDMINIAPTIAAFLGFDFDCQGKAIELY